MMKKQISIIALLALLLAACTAQETATVPPSPTTAPSPTAEPTAEPTKTEPPTAQPAAEEGATLGAIPWGWVSFTSPVEQFTVENPEDYTLTFNSDGTVNIKADCNNAGGAYSADGNSLTIEVGPMTLAACPPDSRGDQFITYLGSAAIYFFEGGNLYIDMMADGGTLMFAPTTVSEPTAGGGSVAESTLPEDVTAQLDTYLQSQVYSEGGDPDLAAPGLVLYVETPDGRYLKVAGVDDIETGTPMQADDILEIGSNTKSMTVLLLMQLVEEGLVSLDDPLSKWLPDQAAILPYGDQITVRQMAQHTAGLWDYGDDIIGGGIADPAELEKYYTPEELVQYAVDNGTPYFAPGEEGMWHYSNTGYVLLGMIIEKITGDTLGNLLQTRIFDPLGMESATLVEGVPQEGEITTHGYYWTEDGEKVDTTSWNASQGWAAGAAAMTAEDLARYGKALAAGELFQNPAPLQEMLTFDSAAIFGDGNGVGAPYGLGLMDFAGDGSVWGHEGQTLGFQSLWFTDPENEFVVVGLTNSASYHAFAFLNVLNILKGNGAQPVSFITLLPVGDLLSTTWAWRQFTNPEEMTDIDEAAGLQLVIGKDGSVIVNSTDCGLAFGAYTSAGMGSISFELDASSLTCGADSPAGQFVQYLNEATSWSFDNGSLLIELPADGGIMILEYIPPQ